MGIAKYGFAGFKYPLSFAFSPLYPLLIRLVFLATGDIVLSAVVVSFVSGIGWVVVLEMTAEHYMPRGDAFNVALLAAFFPMTFFVTTIAYSESLFLLLSTSAWLLYLRKRYAASSLLCAASALSRDYGIVIAVLIFLDLVRGKRLKPALLFSFPVVGCYALYAVYVYSTTGNLLGVLQAFYAFHGPPSVGWFLFQFAQGKIVELQPWAMAFLYYGAFAFILCLLLYRIDVRLEWYSVALFLFFVLIAQSSSLARYLFGNIFPLWMGVKLPRVLVCVAVPLFFLISLLLLYQFNSNLPNWYP
jgi:hypothetical protein